MKKHWLGVLILLLVCLHLPAMAEVSIKEVVTQNLSLHLTKDGKAYDYVILVNNGSEAMDVSGYQLTKEGGKEAYTLPEKLLQPGEELLIYCSGNKEDAPFKLSADGVTICLHNPDGELVEKLAVPALMYNQRYSGNKILEADFHEKGDLYISEILTDNTLILENGETPDYIELHNAGASDMDLCGYGLSDNPNKPAKWRFGKTVLPAGGYMCVYLTDKEIGFGLSSSGECVLLTDPNNKLVDSVTFGAQEEDVALAYIDGAYQKTWLPTPNEANKITSKESD